MQSWAIIKPLFGCPPPQAGVPLCTEGATHTYTFKPPGPSEPRALLTTSIPLPSDLPEDTVGKLQNFAARFAATLMERRDKKASLTSFGVSIEGKRLVITTHTPELGDRQKIAFHAFVKTALHTNTGKYFSDSGSTTSKVVAPAEKVQPPSFVVDTLPPSSVVDIVRALFLFDRMENAVNRAYAVS